MGSEGRRGKKNPGVAVDQLLAQFPRGRERGERHDDGADSRRCQHADDKRNAVGVEQSDVAALAGAESDEPTSQLRGKAFGFGVTDALGVADQQWVIASAQGLGTQYFTDGWQFTWHGRPAPRRPYR